LICLFIKKYKKNW